MAFRELESQHSSEYVGSPCLFTVGRRSGSQFRVSAFSAARMLENPVFVLHSRRNLKTYIPNAQHTMLFKTCYSQIPFHEQGRLVKVYWKARSRLFEVHGPPSGLLTPHWSVEQCSPFRKKVLNCTVSTTGRCVNDEVKSGDSVKQIERKL